MKTLRELISEASTNKKAIGHFNTSNLEGLWAIFEAARELDLPVVVGTSEGEEEFIGTEIAAACVRTIRETYNYPIFLNADHHYTFESVKKSIDAGYDSVILDGAKLPLEENIALTKQCVEYARAQDRDIIVEGELGYIGTSSKVLDGVPEGVELDQLTTPEEAKRFVEETGVDCLAPAVGNIHGMFKGGADPRLNIERIRAIHDAINIPLVLHGGSGNDADFDQAIEAGMSIVHVNTELRVAFTAGLRDFLANNPDETAPYKFMKPAREAMKAKVIEKLKMFARMN